MTWIVFTNMKSGGVAWCISIFLYSSYFRL